MNDTQPVIIVSSGRSGSKQLQDLFGYVNDVDSNHEYNLIKYKPEMIKYLFTKLDVDKYLLIDKLNQHYFKAIETTNNRLWIDSNYSVAPIIDLIIDKYPNAKIVHLLRSGVKVVASWYYKMGNEIYSDMEMRNLQNYLTKIDVDSIIKRKKKNWWYIPNKDSIFFEKFSKSSHFEKICYHWLFSYMWVEQNKGNILDNNFMQIKLEDIVNNEKHLKHLFDFIGINYSPKYFSLVQTPKNVNIPKNYLLSKDEGEVFSNICGALMRHLDYEINDQYEVSYLNK
jgi:hypothetical protein